MWLISKHGFFSAVEKLGDKNDGMLTIRARVRSDLENLREYLPQMGEIITKGGTDYPFRVRVAKVDLAAASAKMVMDIDYSNFKDEVAATQGKARAAKYHDVWATLYSLKETPPKPPTSPSKPLLGASPTPPKPNAFGGVLIDSAGRVLLRSPTNHFDGYVWTFAKGKRDKGETPEETALREVLEETGWHAEIVKKIPGTFPGGTGATEYFLMRPTGQQGKFDWETTEVRWASFEEATTLIAMTTNEKGRERDKAVLAAAIAAYKS